MKKVNLVVISIFFVLCSICCVKANDVKEKDSFLLKNKEIFDGIKYVKEGNYYDIHNEGTTIWYYKLNTAMFEAFVQSPEKSTLDTAFDNPDEGEVYEYSFNKTRRGYDCTNLLLNGDKYIFYDNRDPQNNEVLPGYFYILYDWCEFISEENFQQILYNKGINQKLSNYAFVIQMDKYNKYHLREPLILWLETEEDDYFMVYELKSSYIGDNLPVDSYQFYNYSEFYNRFRIKNGNLNINNKIIYESVVFQDKNVYVPVRVLLNNLGIEVNWVNEERALDFYIEDRGYRYYVDENPPFYKIIDNKVVDFSGEPLTTKEEQHLVCVDFYEFIDDGKMYMSLNSLKSLIEALDKDLMINYDDLTVVINNR